MTPASPPLTCAGGLLRLRARQIEGSTRQVAAGRPALPALRPALSAPPSAPSPPCHGALARPLPTRASHGARTPGLACAETRTPSCRPPAAAARGHCCRTLRAPSQHPATAQPRRRPRTRVTTRNRPLLPSAQALCAHPTSRYQSLQTSRSAPSAITWCAATPGAIPARRASTTPSLAHTLTTTTCDL